MKRKKRTKATPKKVAKTSIIVKISLIIIVLFILFATVFKVTELVLTNKTDAFPKLEISLKDAPIEQIDDGSKDTKYLDNTATITIDDEATSYTNVEVKGRGNATWLQIKKPYQIKFNQKESLFNSSESKKWLLLANYLDPTFLRNDTAFYIKNLLNKNSASQGHFVDLYFDNSYHGLYYLTKKIEIGEFGVNLDSPFGILVELDNIYGYIDGCNYTKNGDCIVVKDSVNDDNEVVATQDFINNLDLLSYVVKQKKYNKILSLIDVDSFAKYYLLNEFIVNPDAYSTSFYMYKNGKEDKIHAGPEWDFDFALANKRWPTEGIDQSTFYSPFETMILKNYLDKTDETPHAATISTILYDLMDIPEFQARVKEIYQETLSGHGEELLEYIKSQAEYIRPAALRDQERWKLKTNFDEEVDYLIDWVAKRYDHFEQTYGKDSAPIN